MAAYALFAISCARGIDIHLRLNFRKPREPVGNCTTIGGSDLKAAHISLSEMSHSRDTIPRSKVSCACSRRTIALLIQIHAYRVGLRPRRTRLFRPSLGGGTSSISRSRRSLLRPRTPRARGNGLVMLSNSEGSFSRLDGPVRVEASPFQYLSDTLSKFFSYRSAVYYLPCMYIKNIFCGRVAFNFRSFGVASTRSTASMLLNPDHSVIRVPGGDRGGFSPPSSSPTGPPLLPKFYSFFRSLRL